MNKAKVTANKRKKIVNTASLADTLKKKELLCSRCGRIMEVDGNVKKVLCGHCVQYTLVASPEEMKTIEFNERFKLNDQHSNGWRFHKKRKARR